MSTAIRYQSSYWERTSFLKKADLIIIGSGIVGLSAALSMRQKKPAARIVVIERGPLPIGASTRNAGFACFGSITELLHDLEKGNKEEVLNLVQKRWKGLQQLRQRVGDAKLGYQNWGGYELFRTEEESVFQQCMDILPELNQELEDRLGEKNIFSPVDPSIADFGLGKTVHLIKNRLEGQIDTGQMMAHLIKLVLQADISIYNGVEVTELIDRGSKVDLMTNYGWQLSADRVLVATNGFARQLLPSLNVQPARNQVLITKPIQELKLKGTFHYDQGFYYFRNINDRILLGGARNLVPEEETTDEFGLTSVIQEALEKMLKEVVAPTHQPEIDYWWSGILGVGAQKTPIVQAYSDNIIIAVRSGGMGVAIGSLIGAEGAALVVN